MATRSLSYRANAALTVTNLQGVNFSSTLISGWTSATIDNTSDLDLDKLVSGKIVLESAGLSAGEIRLYAYTMLDDSNWPDLFSSGTEGTEGTATVHDTEMRDSGMRLLWSTITDTGGSDVYTIPMTSVAEHFGGFLPPKFALFLTHSTNTTLETTGSPNAINLKGVKETVA